MGVMALATKRGVGNAVDLSTARIVGISGMPEREGGTSGTVHTPIHRHHVVPLTSLEWERRLMTG